MPWTNDRQFVDRPRKHPKEGYFSSITNWETNAGKILVVRLEISGLTQDLINASFKPRQLAISSIYGKAIAKILHLVGLRTMSPLREKEED